MEPSVDFRRRNYCRNVSLGNVCKETNLPSMEYLKIELL